jgi:hypothetical protein
MMMHKFLGTDETSSIYQKMKRYDRKRVRLKLQTNTSNESLYLLLRSTDEV